MAEFKNLTICSNEYGINNSSSFYLPNLYINNTSTEFCKMIGSFSRNTTMFFPNPSDSGTEQEPIELATGDSGYRYLYTNSFTQDYLVDTYGTTVPLLRSDGTPEGDDYKDSYVRIKTSGDTHMEIHAGRAPADHSGAHFRIYPSSNTFKWISSAHFTPALASYSKNQYITQMNDSSASNPLANTLLPGSGSYFSTPKGEGAVSRLILGNYQLGNDGSICIDACPIQGGPYSACADVYYLIILTDKINDN